MRQIISLKMQGGSIEDLLTNCKTAAKSAVKTMPLDHKTSLAQAFLHHYFFLLSLRNSIKDATTPRIEYAFEAFSSILSDAGIDIESISKSI